MDMMQMMLCMLGGQGNMKFLNQAKNICNGKSPEQIMNLAQGMCKQSGIDINQAKSQFNSILQQFGMNAKI